MKRFLFATIATLALTFAGLMTPTSAEAQGYRYRTYRPYYYGNYYRPYTYSRPYYYAPRNYGYYRYPGYAYPRYYAPGYYYGYPANRSAGVSVGVPGVGVYVR